MSSTRNNTYIYNVSMTALENLIEAIKRTPQNENLRTLLGKELTAEMVKIVPGSIAANSENRLEAGNTKITLEGKRERPHLLAGSLSFTYDRISLHQFGLVNTNRLTLGSESSPFLLDISNITFSNTQEQDELLKSVLSSLELDTVSNTEIGFTFTSCEAVGSEGVHRLVMELKQDNLIYVVDTTPEAETGTYLNTFEVYVKKGG